MGVVLEEAYEVEEEEETEEAEEEGLWEGKDTKMTKGSLTVMGDDDNDNYTPTHPELEAMAALSNSEPDIALTFGGKYAVATAVRYTEIAFDVFS